MSFNGGHIYTVGDFSLDTEERVLSLKGDPLPITPKMYDVLWLLVRNRGHLVEKEEILQTVWSDSFVEEGNLAVTIRQLRKTLGDDARNPTYIQTVSRRGYRLVADVRPTSPTHVVENLRHISAESGDEKHEPSQSALRSRVQTGPHSPVVALADWKREIKEREGDVEHAGHRTSKLELVPDASASRSRRTVSRVIVLTIALVVVGTLGLLAYRQWGGKSSERTSELEFTRLTSNGKVETAAISPDGRFVAYTIDEGERRSLWLKNVATGSETRITDAPDDILMLRFSKDGNYLFIGNGKALSRIPVLGGVPVPILSNFPRGTSISISPDGGRIAFLRFLPGPKQVSVLAVANTDGTGETQVVSTSRPEIFLRSSSWSPDGKTIATVLLNARGEQEVAVVNLSDGEITHLSSRTWDTVFSANWSVDGQRLYVIAIDDGPTRQIWMIEYPSGEAKTLTTDSHDYEGISIGEDGAIAVVRAEQDAHVWIAPVDDPGLSRQVSTGFEKYDGVHSMSWTADGRVVYANAPSGRSEVWEVDPGTGKERQLATDVGSTSTISPDGSHLVYQDQDGTGLFSLSLTEGTRTRLTTGTDVDPSFAPDGSWIVFTRYADEVALWKIAAQGGQPVKLTDMADLPIFPTVSPDGRFIGYFRSPASVATVPFVEIISSSGGEAVKKFELNIYVPKGFGEYPIQWSESGEALDFVSEVAGVSNIWRQRIDGTPPFQITNFADGSIFYFAESYDGKQLAISRGRYSRDVVLIKPHREDQ